MLIKLKEYSSCLFCFGNICRKFFRNVGKFPTEYMRSQLDLPGRCAENFRSTQQTILRLSPTSQYYHPTHTRIFIPVLVFQIFQDPPPRPRPNFFTFFVFQSLYKVIPRLHTQLIDTCWANQGYNPGRDQKCSVLHIRSVLPPG